MKIESMAGTLTIKDLRNAGFVTDSGYHDNVNQKDVKERTAAITDLFKEDKFVQSDFTRSSLQVGEKKKAEPKWSTLSLGSKQLLTSAITEERISKGDKRTIIQYDFYSKYGQSIMKMYVYDYVCKQTDEEESPHQFAMVEVADINYNAMYFRGIRSLLFSESTDEEARVLAAYGSGPKPSVSKKVARDAAVVLARSHHGKVLLYEDAAVIASTSPEPEDITTYFSGGKFDGWMYTGDLAAESRSLDHLARSQLQLGTRIRISSTEDTLLDKYRGFYEDDDTRVLVHNYGVVSPYYWIVSWKGGFVPWLPTKNFEAHRKQFEKLRDACIEYNNAVLEAASVKALFKKNTDNGGHIRDLIDSHYCGKYMSEMKEHIQRPKAKHLDDQIRGIILETQTLVCADFLEEFYDEVSFDRDEDGKLKQNEKNNEILFGRKEDLKALIGGFGNISYLGGYKPTLTQYKITDVRLRQNQKTGGGKIPNKKSIKVTGRNFKKGDQVYFTNASDKGYFMIESALLTTTTQRRNSSMVLILNEEVPAEIKKPDLGYIVKRSDKDSYDFHCFICGNSSAQAAEVLEKFKIRTNYAALFNYELPEQNDETINAWVAAPVSPPLTLCVIRP